MNTENILIQPMVSKAGDQKGFTFVNPNLHIILSLFSPTGLNPSFSVLNIPK